MSDYQLELKQIVDYPRCRIYRQFIRELMKDRSIRVSGGSGLFYFTVLCSYANFRTSYKRIEGINYTVYPGEWICRIDELSSWFRTRFQHQALAILENLQKQHYITYTKLGRGRIIKFKINGWNKFNTVLEYNAPCEKDIGFFFLPISKAAELISAVRCSEMDIVLDLWMNTIYNDDQVQGSDVGPVVYMRNGTGSPLIGYSDLASRWGISKTTVGRTIKKLVDLNYLTLFSFPGRHGSVIYLKNYLSTSFDISDVMIDKDEVAMSLSINIKIPEDETTDEFVISDEQISVSKIPFCVPESHIKIVVRKVTQILANMGVCCCECAESRYKLSPLSVCREIVLKDQDLKDRKGVFEYLLAINCGAENRRFVFEITLSPADSNF